MLRLRHEVGRDEHGIGAFVGEDHALRRSGGEIDADEARDLDLGGGHPGVAGADDPVDRGEGGLRRGGRQPVRESPDRLCPPGNEQQIDLEQPSRTQENGINRAVEHRPATRPRSP